MSDLRMELIQGQLNDIEENVRSIKATWGNTIMTLDNIKSSLKADRQKAIEEAYHKGFEVGQHEATTLEYQQGLNDAWETITKIAKMPDGERGKVFGETWISNILNGNSLAEITEKLKTHEQQKQEIKVGDEVEAFSGRAIVFGTFTDTKGEKFCRYWYPSDDSFNKGKTENLKRTGRNFPQVAELIEAMKGGAE